jgi:EmrB/QacA subfamily drug resistance transporter
MRKTVPLIVASALIMQQIDSTSLATALPAIADSFHVPALRLHSAITIYLLSLGIFLPISGWIADRFGARKVFCAAIAIFTGASLLCAASSGLTMLISARTLQGFGGAMMLPVSRLILVRSVPRGELISAMVLMSMPTTVGPVVGPLLGGFITSVSSWHWIFLINLPVGILGIALTLLFIDDIPPAEGKPFDFIGFLLSGSGIGALILGLDSASRDLNGQVLGLAVAGGTLLVLYVIHSRRAADPILDLSLFRYVTFRSSLGGGSLFRIGFGALPFMLPLLMQEAFGYSPLQSGAITFASAFGALGMRTVTKRILYRFGFRRVLICNSFIAGAFMAIFACFTQATEPLLIIAVVFAGGVFRALQNTSVNTLAYAEIQTSEMSHATAISQMVQRISQSVGVAFAAILLHVFSVGSTHLTTGAFAMSFIIIASVSSFSGLTFLRLPPTAGDILAGRHQH